jgi:hypothetical protein
MNESHYAKIIVHSGFIYLEPNYTLDQDTVPPPQPVFAMSTPSPVAPAFSFPPFFSYPPYFTIQPVKETRDKQLELWRDLVVSESTHIVGKEHLLNQLTSTSLSRLTSSLTHPPLAPTQITANTTGCTS